MGYTAGYQEGQTFWEAYEEWWWCIEINSPEVTGYGAGVDDSFNTVVANCNDNFEDSSLDDVSIALDILFAPNKEQFCTCMTDYTYVDPNGITSCTDCGGACDGEDQRTAAQDACNAMSVVNGQYVTGFNNVDF